MSLQLEIGGGESNGFDVHADPIIALPTSLDLDGNSHRQKRSRNGAANGDSVISSPDTSGASTPLDRSSLENGYSSCEEDHDENDMKIDNFIKEYVSCLFDITCDISYEDKAKFGELMKDEQARMSFAKYIDAHRSNVKCVDESTFYKLLHSFALVLFECGEADDYMPGKTLMNMAFTYYYIPDQKQVTTEAFSSNDSLMDSQRSKSESETVNKGTLMQRLKKEVEACKQVFQETPSFQELKQGLWRRKPSKSEDGSSQSSSTSHSRSVSVGSPVPHPDMCSPTRKNFLYEHLKNQVIWKSLRFWNASFFTAVHAERKRRCSQNDWSMLSADEQDSTNNAMVNITFGQLGTFINNMKCLGLNKRTCHEFLKKQSVIGGIPEGGQYYQMLVEQIEDDCTF